MQPLQFRSILKRIRWGGMRLGSRLGKQIGTEADYAESWELVDHGDDQSIVTDGPYKDWTLSQLVELKGKELLGRHAGLKQFPLLVKFLDAHDQLSLQVHPNDEQARSYDPTENGKAEAWVIIDAEPTSRLYTGLKRGVNRSQLESALVVGNIEQTLHSFPVKPGDCVFIPAGTVHAIGAGILLAEIQQSSDLTFRLYDWGRLGTDGQPRTLHITDGLDCTDFNRGSVDPVTPRLVAGESHPVEDLVRCDDFVIRRHQTGKPFTMEADGRFHVLMIIGGHAEFICSDERRQMGPGSTVLLPASAPKTQIISEGEIILLESFLP